MKDIILVRATDIIPTDGIVRPLSNSPYIKKINWYPITQKIGDWLKEEGLVDKPDPFRYTEEGYYDEIIHRMSEQTLSYLPYLSDYNPYVLFSLNGLVPDDSEIGFGNNTFHNKRCAIIEPVEHHLEQIKSLEPTDTALIGDVVLSSEATIVINEAYYQGLTDEEKNNLNRFNIFLFRGSLKDAVKKVFEQKGYQMETLSLSAQDGGYRLSTTSEILKAKIRLLSEEHHIPMIRYFNIVSRKNEYPEFYPIDIMGNTTIVYEYYIKRFISSLLIFLEKEDLIPIFTRRPDNYSDAEELFKIIKEAGIERYLDFIKRYNANLEVLQKMNNIPTPEQIITESKTKKTDKELT